ncbi:hypothetical protein N8963_02875 [Candidatus Pelagibacter sp.]|nr:hypothetical protein [Candidatus Pelagibacter sp.]
MIASKIKIFLLFLKTISSYGVVNSGKIFFFELIGLIFLQDLESLSYNDDETSSYLETKKIGEYNVPYIPTPYYFLYLIKKNLLKSNIKKINLIDIGCGYCRPAKYFNSIFQLRFAGIELNKKISNKITKQKIKNFKIYNFNLRNKKKTDIFFKKNLKDCENNIIFISDTVEIDLINMVLNKLKKKKIKLVLINIKFSALRLKKFKITKKIVFKKQSRNIIFLNNYN